MADNNHLYKVVGITTHGASSKVRFGDDIVRRIKQFTKGGASRIDLIELPNEMVKLDALRYAAKHADFQSASDQELIGDRIADLEKGSKNGEVKVKAAKPSLDAIKARGEQAKATVTE
jgi:hypothetical protein